MGDIGEGEEDLRRGPAGVGVVKFGAQFLQSRELIVWGSDPVHRVVAVSAECIGHVDGPPASCWKGQEGVVEVFGFPPGDRAAFLVGRI